MKKYVLALSILTAFAAFGCSDDSGKHDDEPSCGNKVLDAGEVCDGNQFADGKKTCDTAVCTTSCTVDASSCQQATDDKDKDKCANFAVHCDGNSLVTCKAEDGSEIKTECTGDKPVCSDTEKACVASSDNDDKDKCANFAVHCDGNSLVTCKAEDGSEVKTECTGDKPVCSDTEKACVAKLNVEDGISCKDAVIVTCIDGECIEEDCAKNTNGDVACREIKGADDKVADATCYNPNEKESCDGNIYKYCIGDECEIENCAESGQVCSDANGEVKCVDSKIETACGNGIIDGDDECDYAGDKAIFLFGASACHDWIPSFDKGEVACDKDTCKVLYGNCKSSVVEKCIDANTYAVCPADAPEQECETEPCGSGFICEESRDGNTGYTQAGCIPNSEQDSTGCGDGVVDFTAGEACDPGNATLPPTFRYGDTCAKYGKVGELKCTSECKLDSSDCYDASEKETQSYVLPVQSTSNLSTLTNDGILSIRGGFETSEATADIDDNAWIIGGWGTANNTNFNDKYIQITPKDNDISDTLSASIRFQVKRNNENGPKSVKIALYNDGTKIAESSAYEVTTDYNDVLFDIKNVAQYDKLSFRISAYSAATSKGTMTLNNISIWTSKAVK